MNKKTKFKLNETLDNALKPPQKKRNIKALDALLEQFDDGSSKSSVSSLTQTRPRPETVQAQTKPKPKTIQTQTKYNSDSFPVPVRDFNKRANSLERDALPAGLFPGASKAVYDALYLRTFGAVEPKRLIQATRKQLLEWTGIKNIKTINAHLKKLKDSSLIKISNFTGEQGGSYYEVFLPDETVLPRPEIAQITSTQPRPDPNRKLDVDQTQKMVWVGSGNLIENKGTYENPNTSFKDIEKNDDEAFAEIGKVLSEISEKVSGKRSAKSQKENWKELAQLLAMELEIAAARTNSISNVPAFLTEHLRRRLLTKPESRTTAGTSGAKNISKSLQVGKSADSKQAEIQSYEAEVLTKAGKEAVLKTFKQYIEKGQRDFVMSLEDTYTGEDWRWLLENLPDEKPKE